MPGIVDGLPVGMMLVAKAFDEETIHCAAAAFENRPQLEIAEGWQLPEMAHDDRGQGARYPTATRPWTGCPPSKRGTTRLYGGDDPIGSSRISRTSAALGENRPLGISW